MEAFYNRMKAVFSDHKTEMLVAVAIGFVLGQIF